MNVVILHHHFHSGGVLQVVLGHLHGWSQLDAAARPKRLLLMHGGRDKGLRQAIDRGEVDPQQVEITVVPQLEYDLSSSSPVSPQQLTDALEQQLSAAGIDRGDTVLHVHNPTLGKTAAVPEALRLLAQRGWHLLAHLHDFPEDLRPENYRRLIATSGAETPAAMDRWLYPDSPRIRYLTLVHSDAEMMRQAGVGGGRIAVLPNPVISQHDPGSADRTAARKELGSLLKPRISADQTLLLYPVRGIRRKNLGELLLWASLVDRSTWFSVTLPPTTPIELASWQRWRRWSEALGLNILLGSGIVPGVSLPLNRAACDRVLTTSVAEGFGMAFLEPWLAEREVVGRDLIHATDDFRRAGIQLDRLHREFPVPLPSSRLRQAHGRIAKERTRLWNSLPAAFRGAPDAGFSDSSVDDASIDFGRLPVQDQQWVLAQIRRDDGYLHDCRQVASPLLRSAILPADPKVTAANRERLIQHFAPNVIAAQLMDHYRQLLQSCDTTASEGETTKQRSGDSNASAIVQQLKTRRPFCPLRIESPILDQPYLRLHRSLVPRSTGVTTQLNQLTDVRAVIIDIYGTLVISGSGDVGSVDRHPRVAALQESCRALGIELSGPADREVQRLHQIIGFLQEQLRSRGVEQPEIDIVRAWYLWLSGFLSADSGTAVEAGDSRDAVDWDADRFDLARQLSDEFEARANPCDAMPGAMETIDRLAAASLDLGIVSNAQAFTPRVVSVALNRNWDELPFDPDLTFFSFRFAHAKPGHKLFDRLRAALAVRGIAPHQAIYIGNDMLNDVMAAARAGLRTVLFAGDLRSLRRRESDPRVEEYQPDAVITHWSQLTRLLPQITPHANE